MINKESHIVVLILGFAEYTNGTLYVLTLGLIA